ncbi:MAG: hypothetical protein ACKOJF_20425, partial [Planctomycetaceae bacterium]
SGVWANAPRSAKRVVKQSARKRPAHREFQIAGISFSASHPSCVTRLGPDAIAFYSHFVNHLKISLRDPSACPGHRALFGCRAASTPHLRATVKRLLSPACLACPDWPRLDRRA